MVEGGCVTEGAHLHERRVRREGEAAAELLLVEVLEAEDGVADGTAIVLTRRLVRRHEVDETHLPEVLSLGLGPARPRVLLDEVGNLRLLHLVLERAARLLRPDRVAQRPRADADE